MEVICIENEAFYALIEQVVDRLSEKFNEPKEKWIDEEEAMKRLKITAKSTLQSYRDQGRIRFTQPTRKIILYDRESIEEYLEKHARKTF